MRPSSQLALILVSALALAGGCYTGAQSSRDINLAWQGHSRSSLEARWGKPAQVKAQPQGDAMVLIWTSRHLHLELPGANASLVADEDGVDVRAELRPGRAWHTTRVAMTAHVDSRGLVEQVDGPSVRWGAPNEANLHWGLLFGAHAGMGRLDDTSTALPGGGIYIGGMLGPTLGLIGIYELASGKDDAGGAMGMAWGLAVKWWPVGRWSVHGGPAMVLAFDPGFEDLGLEPGVTGGASYAVVKSGTFALDVRLDVTSGTSTSFGTVGIGVNVN